jgi:hypothetical protein
MNTIPTELVAAVYARGIIRSNPGFHFCALRVLSRLILLSLIGFFDNSTSAQVQQVWVARYNNGILNGTNKGVKMALDSSGNA